MKTQKMNRKQFVGSTLLAGGALALVGCKEEKTAETQADQGAYCGLYCGACPKFTNGECTGCKGPEETLAAHCKECEIRSCAAMKGVKSCAECAGFPCPKTEAFHNSGNPKGEKALANSKTIQVVGYEKWLAAQAVK
ncbi:DUF3795 domain-containing protein [Pontiella sulfatireligans]|uniref:DUF3795 domain-containing protein n=1 Tax=Pontiella sulfatireligans TaxID=2750658 RepID=A0A6C2UKM2_9BACT|nr:DUF3795 domain-containing protein [Pontiella sulfatireligans]VGO19951.1 hypothetical protein SCARR_02011 [Pontiella sulfatireligans]